MKKIMMAAMAGTLFGAIFAAPLADTLHAQENDRASSRYVHLDLFGDIFDQISAYYVEEVDPKELIEYAISGMLSSLDPHSSYLAPEDFSDMQEQTRGQFGGLGIEVTMEEGFVKVVSPIDGTPADKAGMRSGDFITHVNDESLLGLSLDQAVEKLRGPVGSEALLRVAREGEDEPLEITIIRDTIRITAVRGRAEGEAVVLRVTTFSQQTYRDLAAQLEDKAAEAGGMENITGVVLDLRNNPGGLLSQAIKVTDAFLEQGEIVSTRGRNPQDTERFGASPGDLAQGKPLVVLINGGSASASEIVAGALQDHRRAIVIGEKSFGKGSVQTVIPLQGNGGIRLTTARYYTPSGRSIQGLGIEPDILVEQIFHTEEEEEDQPRFTTEAELRGSLTNDSLSEDELEQLEAERERLENAAELRKDDLQLAYALDVLKSLALFAEQ